VGPLHGVAWAFESKDVKYDDEDWFDKTNFSYGLIKDTKAYHIHLLSLSNSFIKKSYNDYTIGRNLCIALRGRLVVKLLSRMMKIEVKKYESG
jgi:hypothetical protein